MELCVESSISIHHQRLTEAVVQRCVEGSFEGSFEGGFVYVVRGFEPCATEHSQLIIALEVEPSLEVVAPP